MYFLSLSLFIPPKPAPYVTSISIEVGSEKGSMSAGSRRSEFCGWSGALMGFAERAGMGVDD